MTRRQKITILIAGMLLEITGICLASFAGRYRHPHETAKWLLLIPIGAAVWTLGLCLVNIFVEETS